MGGFRKQKKLQSTIYPTPLVQQPKKWQKVHAANKKTTNLFWPRLKSALRPPPSAWAESANFRPFYVKRADFSPPPPATKKRRKLVKIRPHCPHLATIFPYLLRLLDSIRFKQKEGGRTIHPPPTARADFDYFPPFCCCKVRTTRADLD